ncbi:hypothetical protein BX616_009165, partial [Lobosporangium transversale]
MKFITLVAALPVSAAAILVHAKDTIALQEEQIQPQNPAGEPAPTSFKSYIVVFKSTVAAQSIEKIEREVSFLGGRIVHRYNTVLKGFSAYIPGSVVSALKTNPAIDYIEEDGT